MPIIIPSGRGCLVPGSGIVGHKSASDVQIPLRERYLNSLPFKSVLNVHVDAVGGARVIPGVTDPAAYLKPKRPFAELVKIDDRFRIGQYVGVLFKDLVD